MKAEQICKQLKQKEYEFAATNPPKVGDCIVLHCQGYWHCFGTIAAITDKAIQIKGKPYDDCPKVYTCWFPKSALDTLSGVPCSEQNLYESNIKAWFRSKMNGVQERLLGLTD